MLGANKVLLRCSRNLSDRQCEAVALLIRIGCAQPGRHVAERTLRSLLRLGLVRTVGFTGSAGFALTTSGQTVARYLREAA